MGQSLAEQDVLQSPAVAIWVGLEAAGLALKLADDGALLVGPAGRVTPEHVATVRVHKEALRLLVRLYDLGVEQRRAAFELRVALAPAPQVPVLLWRADVPYVRGVCFSCADATERDAFGLCWRCLLARRLALGQSIAVDLLDGYADARLVA